MSLTYYRRNDVLSIVALAFVLYSCIDGRAIRPIAAPIGTNRCTAFVGSGGAYGVEFWCQGSYSEGGNCHGQPASVRVFEPSAPANESCENGVPNCTCGVGSYVSSHPVCTDGTHSTYGFYCKYRDITELRGFVATLNCCYTCNPNYSSACL